MSKDKKSKDEEEKDKKIIARIEKLIQLFEERRRMIRRGRENRKWL